MDKYIKDDIINDINDNEKNVQLLQCIFNTRKDLNQAHINFDFAEDELIDFYTYQIKAIQSKLDYLIRIAKSKNLSINPLTNRAV